MHPDEHHYEFNPIVKAFQKMTLEKWEEYLETETDRLERYKKEGRRDYFPGAGLTRLQVEEHLAKRDAVKASVKSQIEESVS